MAIRWGAKKEIYNAKNILSGNAGGSQKQFYNSKDFYNAKEFWAKIRGEPKIKFIMLKHFEWQCGGSQKNIYNAKIICTAKHIYNAKINYNAK